MSDYFLNKIYDSLLSNKPVPKKPEPIVEKKETFKPLSKVYEVLVREKVEHVAVYGSKDDTDPKNILDRSAPGLASYGVGSKVGADRIKQQARLETANIPVLIENLFKIKKIPSRKQMPEAFDVFYSALEATNIQNVETLFKIISTPDGQFNALDLQPYNCIERAIDTIQNHPLAKENPIDKESLKSLLITLLPKQPKMASTATGPGELFFSLFSNASLAKEKGSKSGDLAINGQTVEVKATSESGARLGGDGPANEALNIIPQKLIALGKGYIDRDQFVLKGLNEIKNLFNEIQKIDFNTFIKNVESILKRYNFNKVNLHQIGKGSLEVSKFKQSITDYNTPVNNKFGVLAKAQTPENYFINMYQKYINNLIDLLKQKMDAFKKIERTHTTDELDLLLFDAINFIKKNQPDIDYNELIEYIVLIRNERNTESPLRAELKQIFKDKESIFSFASSAENLEKLIGAIHLYAYTLVTKPNYYLLLNSEYINNNNVLILLAPKSLQEAMQLATTTGVNFDTRVDSGKTKYAKSVNILYTPS